MGLKGGISIDADSGPLGYVLWCCGGRSQDFFTFIQIGSGHTVGCVLIGICFFWNLIKLGCAFFEFAHLQCNQNGMCPFCNIFFWMCSFCNVIKMEITLFRKCSYWNSFKLIEAKILDWFSIYWKAQLYHAKASVHISSTWDTLDVCLL